MRACFNSFKEGRFYVSGRASSLVFCDQVGGMHLMHWLPSVVALGVSLPPDQVLELPQLSMMSVANDAINLVLLLPINQ